MGMDDSLKNAIFETGSTEPQLAVTFLLNTSESMRGEKISELNKAMEEALDDVEETALEREVSLRLRVIEFNDEAKWICGTNEMNGLEHIDWKPLAASGKAAAADALRLAAGLMSRKYLGSRQYRPVVIMITDGESNDPADTAAAVNELKERLKSTKYPKADKIIRIAFGVKGANQTELQKFASVGCFFEDGSTEWEKVPLVFSTDKVWLLKYILERITVSNYSPDPGFDEDPVMVDLSEDTWI